MWQILNSDFIFKLAILYQWEERRCSVFSSSFPKHNIHFIINEQRDHLMEYVKSHLSCTSSERMHVATSSPQRLDIVHTIAACTFSVSGEFKSYYFSLPFQTTFLLFCLTTKGHMVNIFLRLIGFYDSCWKNGRGWVRFRRLNDTVGH